MERNFLKGLLIAQAAISVLIALYHLDKQLSSK